MKLENVLRLSYHVITIKSWQISIYISKYIYILFKVFFNHYNDGTNVTAKSSRKKSLKSNLGVENALLDTEKRTLKKIKKRI